MLHCLPVHHLTTSCSACFSTSPSANCVFRLCLLPMCYLRTVCVKISFTVQVHALFLVPALFHLPQPQHRGSCFLSLVLGTDLITYLFSLSYSKLLWLRVLLRKDIFLPPLLLAAFHLVSPSASHYLTPH